MKKRSVLTALRFSKGFSQTELAKELGISQQYLSQIETGFYPCTDELLKRIATKLETDFLQLRKQILERR